MARILVAASALLDEVGFDRLSTNLVCSRAGLTPPALYRYFPDKYAVMEELGRRLMEAQNAALYQFLEGQNRVLLEPEALAVILRGQLEQTFRQPGGRWIMRSLHSTPALIHVRLQSHQAVVKHLVSRHQKLQPTKNLEALGRLYRIAVDTGYAATELLLDEPRLDVDAVTADVGRMIAGLLSTSIELPSPAPPQ